MDEVLIEERRGGELRLTLNRPERLNAIDHALGMALLGALDRATDDPEVRVVVLAGADGAFCAGDDLSSLERSLDGEYRDAPFFHGTRDTIYTRIVHAIYQCPKPVLAALGGVCAGAGTEIACAADIRLAAERARIGSRLVRIGQVGNAIALPRVVGPARAAEIYMTGRLVCSAEALRIGLVHEVLADDALDARVDELAAQLAASATKAIGFYKQLLLRTWGESPAVGLRMQDDAHRATVTEIEDGAEGVRAFAEGRPPRFTGR
ncbi:enoyl-CoA hydratase/isomerase family protein [Conexibacter arvalis]|uniref:Enoyl-CoA hydratase/carnithine racemase n=1 Tax=Conexibacter arvalis TaxID=912552 RepID=A0A840I8J4_9ACTN|nr:enoyl-CoA hydratase-related protein [Conexibacter arvalis]MBB4660645.1 enoyl-CoA hydratase/carnithine racemase [Conexibacter arvalis]